MPCTNCVNQAYRALLTYIRARSLRAYGRLRHSFLHLWASFHQLPGEEILTLVSSPGNVNVKVRRMDLLVAQVLFVVRLCGDPPVP